MKPAGVRFSHQALGGQQFSQHLQQSQSHLHHANSHHQPGSAGLPPPSFNTHPGFPPTNPASALNPFGLSNGTSGLAAGFGGGGGLGGGGTAQSLNSQAAMLGFHNGVALQQQLQHQREAARRPSGGGKAQNKSRIRDVWAGNLAQEMQNLRELIERYPYVSMDTEFPGVVARPMGNFTSKADYHYQTLRCNVDLLSIIQLGITLFNEDGETPPPHAENGPYQVGSPPCPSTWQFNFQFSVKDDMHNGDSIEFLQNSGMNMEMHEQQGIDPRDFGSQLITSGLTMFDDVKWISFHAAYDFAYLVKIMHPKALPDEETEYRTLAAKYFPVVYDIKYMVKTTTKTQMVNGNTPLSPTASQTLQNLVKGGLQDLADELQVKRAGTAHQAGSDSLLTGKIFWEMKKTIFNGDIHEEKYVGHVWGLNATTHPTYADGPSTPNLNGATIYIPNGAPTTPNTNHTALAAQTPSQSGPNGGSGLGSLTPGGAFARFGFKTG